MEIAWHVAQLRTNSAGVAIDNLRAQGLPTYNPHYAEKHRRRGWLRYQLFPSYLFVGDVAGRERSVNSTKGILSLLGAIRSGEIERLRAMENEHGNIVLPKVPVVTFSNGQKVRVRTLDLVNAIYVGQKAADRSIILLSILGDRREVEVKNADLIAA